MALGLSSTHATRLLEIGVIRIGKRYGERLGSSSTTGQTKVVVLINPTLSVFDVDKCNY